MSLADKLENIYTRLDEALDSANDALVAKGGDRALDMRSLGDAIANIDMTDWSLQRVVSRTSEPFTIKLPKVTNLTYSIGNYAFYRCSGLTSITLPDSISYIGDYAFYLCSNLTSITIPDVTRFIGSYAFYYCSGLTSITIPDAVIEIGNHAFCFCSNLANIYVSRFTPPTLGNTDAIPTTTTIHVPIGSGEAYKSATNWSYHSARIVEDIEI